MICTSATIEGRTIMSERFHHEEDIAEREKKDFTISDGMDPIFIPASITKENYLQLFGGALPEGISPDLFESGSLELEEGQ